MKMKEMKNIQAGDRVTLSDANWAHVYTVHSLNGGPLLEVVEKVGYRPQTIDICQVVKHIPMDEERREKIRARAMEIVLGTVNQMEEEAGRFAEYNNTYVVFKTYDDDTFQVDIELDDTREPLGQEMFTYSSYSRTWK